MILAVGATGNIGRELVSRLVARGHDVRAVSRDPGGARAVLPVSPVVAGESPAHEDPVVRAALVPGVCDTDSPGVLPTVADVTGRPAHAFERWMAAHAAAFSPV